MTAGLSRSEAAAAARAMSGVSPHFAYRVCDESGTVLYVGSTNDLRRRMGEHRRLAAWWGQAATATSQEHPTEAEARLAERAWIREFQPAANQVRYETPTRAEGEMETEAAVSAAMFDLIFSGLAG